MENDIVIASGTVEQKLYTVVSEVNRLNLSPEVRSFDKEDNELVELGKSLTDVIFKTEELEMDREQKLLRQVELLKQGHVFMQENWVKEWRTQKDGVTKKDVGKIKDVNWTKKLKKVFDGPRRQILFTPGVYLGNIREFQMYKQPYIFTAKITSYSEAKSRYGGQDKEGKYVWERWCNVPMARTQLATPDNLSSLNVNDGFALTDIPMDMMEEIHYQDSVNNEYQIFLNGIAMLPAGFPLSAISPNGDYNIEKQVLRVINPFFAYGRSFVSSTARQSEILDEILRLLILKTRKSIHPPYANIGHKVISAKSLMPGRITMGIDPAALVPIGQEGQGATASEYQMLREMRESIDRTTVSPQTSGMQGKAGTTAFEVNVLTQQAQKVISLIVLAASLLEQKLAYLRLNNILVNYFTPIDTQFDETRGEIKRVFRKTVRKTNLEGRGLGARMVIPTDGALPGAEDVMKYEDYLDTPEPQEGHRRLTRDELGMVPVEAIFLSPDELANAKLTFHIEIDSKPIDTTSTARSEFREELQDIAALAGFGSVPNVKELEERHAVVWGRRKDKLFSEPAPVVPGAEGEGPSLSQIANQNSAGVSTAVPQ